MRASILAARIAIAAAGPMLAGCAVEVAGTGILGDKQGTVRASNIEAVVDASGACEADLSLDPALLRQKHGRSLIGVSECELVALNGRPDGLKIDETGPRRRVTMRYGSGQSYHFVDNRLVRIGA
jgi:hypothetical protein